MIFFSNPKITRAKLMEPHYANTVERIKGSNAKYILAIQDGMRLNYTNHKAKTEIGRIGKSGGKEQYGLIQHALLCVTEKNEPLGLLDLNYFHYDEFDSDNHRHHRTIDEKATRCWLEALARGRKRLGKTDKTLINIADREGDFFEFIDALSTGNEVYVVRAKHNRHTGEKHRDRNKKLFDCVKETPDRGEMIVSIQDFNTREIKDIILKLKVLKDVLIPPTNNGKEEKDIHAYKAAKVNVVMAYDDNHEWILLTNLPVETQEEVEKVISIYKLRWHVEDFHKIQKTGYQVDELYLHSSLQAMENALAMAAISACRLYWLIYVGRVENTILANKLFEEHEWKSVYVYFKDPIPEKPPTLREVIIRIARLGGYKVAKVASLPGAKTMWIGFQKFSTISVMYKNMLSTKT
jgi:transposase Tn5 family protein